MMDFWTDWYRIKCEVLTINLFVECANNILHWEEKKNKKDYWYKVKFQKILKKSWKINICKENLNIFKDKFNMKLIFVLSLYVFVAEAKVRIIEKAQQVPRKQEMENTVFLWDLP